MYPSQSALDAFFLSLGTNFWTGYNNADVFWNKIAMEVPSSSSATLQGWIDKLPIMRKWVGSRVKNAVTPHNYRLTNDPYEGTVAINKFAIADDEHGVYAPMAARLGDQAAKWPDYMIAAMLSENSGDGPTAFDGKTMFANDHPCDTSSVNTTSTYDNKLALALDANNFMTARATMRLFKGADGKPMNIIGDTLVVPPELEYTAMALMNATFIAPQTIGSTTQVGANDNVIKGMANVVVIPELSEISTTGWYLLSSKGPIKPFIFQQRQAPMFVYKNGPNEDGMFYDQEIVYGVEARGQVGVSLPFLALRSVP